jgi:Protein of unknown function (DUF3429)
VSDVTEVAVHMTQHRSSVGPFGFSARIPHAMTTSSSPLSIVLPIAGVVPFVGGAVLMLAGVPALFGLSVETMMLSYGLLIASFLAGVHWGQYLSGVRTRVNLLISSNVVALAAWFGFLLLPKRLFCLLLCVLFILFNSIDGHLLESAALSPRYKQVRAFVTISVCVSMLIAGFV